MAAGMAQSKHLQVIERNTYSSLEYQIPPPSITSFTMDNLFDSVFTRSLLVTSARSSTSGLLELSALRSDIWSSVAMRLAWSWTKVFASLASCSRSLNENRVLASWWTSCQLVECQTLATCLDDSLSGSLGKSERTYGHLWNLKDTLIVQHASYDNSDLILARFVAHVVDL